MELEKVYENRFNDATWNQRNIMWKVLCRDFFEKYVKPEDDVLDLAAGYCDFINNIAYSKKTMGRRIAVDLNADVKKHAAKHVDAFICEASELNFLEDGSVDVVFVSNFFEHVKEKEEILTILSECNRVLRKNGKLLILQPNINYLGGKYWDFFDHYTPINEKSMSEAIEISSSQIKFGGWKITRLISKFLPYTTKSRIPQRAWMIRMYCHCPIAWKIMGKQLFLCAEKV